MKNKSTIKSISIILYLLNFFHFFLILEGTTDNSAAQTSEKMQASIEDQKITPFQIKVAYKCYIVTILVSNSYILYPECCLSKHIQVLKYNIVISL